MTTLLNDLRYSLRGLLKSPGFTAAAVLALGLGIGANAAIFSSINAVLLRPLAAPEPDRLVTPLALTRQGISSNFSYPDFIDMRRDVEAFSGVLARDLVHVAFSGPQESEILWGEIVSGNYFDVLGVRPSPGRGFLPEEDGGEPLAHPVVVISRSLWERRFASDPGILERSIVLDGREFAVAGVAPEGFVGTKFGLAMDFWIPLAMQPLVKPEMTMQARGGRWFSLLARLKPGITVDQADASLKVFAKQLETSFPGTHTGRSMAVVPEWKGRFPGGSSDAITMASSLAMIVAGLVLLMACANVANLLLARAAGRGREIGVRLALGATRSRLLGLLLTEGLLLSAAGGALGLLLAVWSADALRSFVPPLPYPIAMSFAPDGRVLLFTLGVSLLSTAVFALLPSLRASRMDPLQILRGEATVLAQGRRFSLRDGLLLAQVTASIIVLSCAALFIGSLRAAQRIDPGFSPGNVLLATYDVSLLGYGEEKGRAFQRRLTDEIGAVAGVQSVSLARYLPLGDSSSTTGPILAEGLPAPTDGSGIAAMVNTVSPGFFETLRTPIVTGRDFAAADGPGSRSVVIVNQTLARLLWPGEEAVGRRLRIGSVQAELAEVVGVARDGKYLTLGEAPRPHIFLPAGQSYRGQMTLVVRTGGDPTFIAGDVRRVARALDARLPLFDVKTMTDHMEYAFWWTRMGASLASALAFLALLLAGVGLYALIAYSVARRTREIGIRMAMGARSRDVIRLVVGRGLRLTVAGLIAGTAVAFGISRLLSSVLYGGSSSSPALLAAAGAVLLAVAAAACLIPARRATRINPTDALRAE